MLKQNSLGVGPGKLVFLSGTGNHGHNTQSYPLGISWGVIQQQ